VARLVLLGLPGSGKSSVGRATASRLGVDFIDTDHALEEQEGVPAGTLMRRDGVELFRQKELAVLREALNSNGVVATGGGVVTTTAARALLSTQQCVWLRARTQDLVRRVRGGDRPLLEGGARKRLSALALERDPFYEQLAQHQVNASQSIEVIVEELCRLVGE
jgi:shikimate kinase